MEDKDMPMVEGDEEAFIAALKAKFPNQDVNREDGEIGNENHSPMRR